MKKILALVLLITCLSVYVHAGANYAYIYIEGDKTTPFYVKIEGTMAPRLGKNYCILSNLDAGVTNIEILFQQNKYPPQKFAINIPEGGSRGFKLQKVNDRQYSLYDFEQGSYIVSGNKAEDDKLLPRQTEEVDPQKHLAIATPVDTDEIPQFKPEKKAKAVKKEKVAVTEEVAPVSAPEPAQKRFLDEIEFNTDEDGVASRGHNSGAARSSGCTAMSNSDFEDFALALLDLNDDDAKIKMLGKKKSGRCFSTEQVRIIGNNMVTQSGRYEVARLLYPYTSDQENYNKLESLFKTNYLKEKFRELLR